MPNCCGPASPGAPARAASRPVIPASMSIIVREGKIAALYVFLDSLLSPVQPAVGADHRRPKGTHHAHAHLRSHFQAVEEWIMKIGIIGAGQIGSTLTRRLRDLGHEVQVANSRDPKTLASLAAETGAVAVEVGMCTSVCTTGACGVALMFGTVTRMKGPTDRITWVLFTVEIVTTAWS